MNFANEAHRVAHVDEVEGDGLRGGLGQDQWMDGVEHVKLHEVCLLLRDPDPGTGLGVSPG